MQAVMKVFVDLHLKSSNCNHKPVKMIAVNPKRCVFINTIK